MLDFEYNCLSLKEYKNKKIYILVILRECNTEYKPILFFRSNYSALFPLSNIEKKTFYSPFLDYSIRLLFIDISEYPYILC